MSELIPITDVRAGDEVQLSTRYATAFKCDGIDSEWLTVSEVFAHHRWFEGGVGLGVEVRGQARNINIGWFSSVAKRPQTFCREYLGRPVEPTHAEMVADELVQDFIQITERYDAEHPSLCDQARNAARVRDRLLRIAQGNGARAEFLSAMSDRKRPPRRDEIIPDYEFHYRKYTHETIIGTDSRSNADRRRRSDDPCEDRSHQLD